MLILLQKNCPDHGPLKIKKGQPEHLTVQKSPMSVDSVIAIPSMFLFFSLCSPGHCLSKILLSDCVIFPRRSISIPDEVCISIGFLSGHTRGSLPSSSHPSSYRSRSSPEDPLPPTLPHRCSHPHQDSALRDQVLRDIDTDLLITECHRGVDSHQELQIFTAESRLLLKFSWLHTRSSAHPAHPAFPPGFPE